MRPQIPVPSKGQQLRATWGAQVANRVNELCAMAPAGALHREGFGGIGDQALPKNLRDRPAASGMLMPFDISAEVQSSQDGTQKRLVIACINGAVNWCGPGFTTHQDDTPGVQTDVPPKTTVYTGEWASAVPSGTYTVFLNYKLSLAPDWDTAVSPLAFDTSGTKIYQKITAEKIVAPDDGPTTLPYGTCGLYFLTETQVLVSWLRLGKVTVSAGGAVSVSQAFHGDLLLSDLLTIADGGGGGDDGWHAPGCWEIAVELVEGEAGQPAQIVVRWTNQYIMLGAEMLSANVNDDPTTHAGKFVAVQITDGASGAGAISIQEYATAADMATATNDATKFTVPLGKLNAAGSGYEIDMRFIPHAGAWDAYIAPASGGNGGAS